MEKEVTIFIEKYVKRRGGKSYCKAYYHVGSITVEVGEFQTDSEEVAKAKAAKIIKKLAESI